MLLYKMHSSIFLTKIGWISNFWKLKTDYDAEKVKTDFEVFEHWHFEVFLDFSKWHFKRIHQKNVPI